MINLKPVFLRTRHVYGSYADMWHLVELCGFETCYIDEPDFQDPNVVYIVTPFTGELTAKLTGLQRKSKMVHWCLERPDAPGHPPMSQVVDQALQYVDAMWVSDRTVSKLDSRLKFVVFGSRLGLRTHLRVAWDACVYDFAHISYVWGRRVGIYSAIEGQGLVLAPDQGDVGRDAALAKTKVMVNTQQHTPLRVVAPIRFAVAAAFDMPIVTEPIDDPYPYDDGLIQAETSRLPRAVWEVCRQSQWEALQRSDAMAQRLCVGEFRFDYAVLRGLEETFG